jgi:hypothetical protein
MVKMQAPVPTHAPDQLVKIEVASAMAVRLITEPAVNCAEQVTPQLIPAGEETTVPFPEADLLTVRLYWVKPGLTSNGASITPLPASTASGAASGLRSSGVAVAVSRWKSPASAAGVGQ